VFLVNVPVGIARSSPPTGRALSHSEALSGYGRARAVLLMWPSGADAGSLGTDWAGRSRIYIAWAITLLALTDS